MLPPVFRLRVKRGKFELETSMRRRCPGAKKLEVDIGPTSTSYTCQTGPLAADFVNVATVIATSDKGLPVTASASALVNDFVLPLTGHRSDQPFALRAAKIATVLFAVPESTCDADQDPMDCGSHGTAVASVIAGSSYQWNPQRRFAGGVAQCST